jgi:hypothetical protein
LIPSIIVEKALADWRDVIPASLAIREMISFLFISNLLLPVATKSMDIVLTVMLKRRGEAVKSKSQFLIDSLNTAAYNEKKGKSKNNKKEPK